MNKFFLNPYLFFIIFQNKFVVWDYKNHQQFELEKKYLDRLLELSENSTLHSELDEELLAANLILNEEIQEEWGWDCLSKIFHFGTKIRKNDLSDINISDPSLFSREYIRLSEDVYSTSPAILTEKKGEVVSLPAPDLSSFNESNFLSVLSKRKTCRTFRDESISLDIMSTLLYVSFGNFHFECEEYTKLGLRGIGLRKTSPAGGGLHSCETYLLAQNINGIDKGIYHYQAHNHALTLISSGDVSCDLTEIFCGQFFVKNMSLGIFITSRFEKLWHKYPHSRAYRVALLDAGHVSQTFQLVATALNLNPWLSGAFIDDEISKLLMLDKLSEQPLFFVGAGIGPWSSIDPVTRKMALEENNKNEYRKSAV